MSGDEEEGFVFELFLEFGEGFEAHVVSAVFVFGFDVVSSVLFDELFDAFGGEVSVWGDGVPTLDVT